MRGFALNSWETCSKQESLAHFNLDARLLDAVAEGSRPNILTVVKASLECDLVSSSPILRTARLQFNRQWRQQRYLTIPMECNHEWGDNSALGEPGRGGLTVICDWTLGRCGILGNVESLLGRGVPSRQTQRSGDDFVFG